MTDLLDAVPLARLCVNAQSRSAFAGCGTGSVGRSVGRSVNDRLLAIRCALAVARRVDDGLHDVHIVSPPVHVSACLLFVVSV